ncbi:MAG: AAA family ATPase, partial [Deltaproteobacteria bacterium]
HAARLHVNATGTPERDQWFTAAVALVRDLGRGAGVRILASEPVGRIVGEQFALEPLRSRTSELDRVPGTPLLVLSERTQHGGTHRRFVGRKEPFRKVGEILARAAKSGARSVVLIGEPGTGKTRFLEEVVYRLRRMNHPVNWYRSACLSHQRDVPLSAVQSMLRVVLGIDVDDAASMVVERAQRLRELGCSSEELHAVTVVLGAADAGNARDPGATLRGAFLKIATRLAQDQMTVFVWDSAEAMDDESQALVDDLVRNAGRARVVVMVACRPGFIYAWKDAAKVDEIRLGPLAEDEARQLVAQRLGVAREAALPRDLLEDLWTKGAGNPLFVEEYTKSLQDAGALEAHDGEVLYRKDIAEVGVPKTLRGLVSSEIARLAPAQRQVLQVASVIGPRFHRDVVAEVGGFDAHSLDETLGGLLARGNLVQSGTDEYSFAHDLRREVVYEGLPLEPRRALHGTVAAVLERLYPERLDDLAERLAHHYRESNDRARAIEYLVRAARRQQSESAYAAATQNLSRAIELVLASPRSDPEHVMSLYGDLGMSAIRSRTVTLGVSKLRLGLAYAEDLGARPHIVRMLVLLGRLLALAHQVGEAVPHFERARS